MYIYGESIICPINGKTGQGGFDILAADRNKGGELDAARLTICGGTERETVQGESEFPAGL